MRSVLMAAVLATAAMSSSAIGQPAPAATAAQAIPDPVLKLSSIEAYAVNGAEFIRYRYDVANKASYPAAMFAAAPNLPPCGNNANSARAWVDFYDQDGKRLYGFCALGKPEDLSMIWFAKPRAERAPQMVYIEINDRLTNKKYRSNLAATSF